LFRHNGFLKHPNWLPQERVERLKEGVWKGIRGEIAPVVRDGEGRTVRISNLLGRDSIFLEKEAWISEAGILDQTLPVPMPAGGMLMIDSLIFHGAGKNRTDDTRMSMTVGYHSVDELSKVENPQRILVRGEQIYLGSEY
jgi:hypothetical protein